MKVLQNLRMFLIASMGFSCISSYSSRSHCSSHSPGSSGGPAQSFNEVLHAFEQGYTELGIDIPSFDYRDELRSIPGPAALEAQDAFFAKTRAALAGIPRGSLSPEEQVSYDHLLYEIEYNSRRIALSKEWRTSDHAIPAGGLSTLPGWYAQRITRFTNVEITPEELFAFGEKEVARVKDEIRRIQNQLGYADDPQRFQQSLQKEEFLLREKNQILDRYAEINRIVKSNLYKLFSDTAVSEIAFMEWPGADRFTPPGYYSPQGDNAYGMPVFHFNFHDGTHNVRAMEWLFMHEAVPGHHYQWWMRNQAKPQPSYRSLFSYSGNFEGWAAYVEYHGKTLGLYSDPYSELGKWEWDLVRSTRILIDVGIHHYGWTYDKAMECWKSHITGQDHIAEREIIRCTNWPGQALSYKVGAWKIQEMADRLRMSQPDFDIKAFHRQYLAFGQVPLEVIEMHIGNADH
jgi:uncharacterized protein (DUF885 family)